MSQVPPRRQGRARRTVLAALAAAVASASIAGQGTYESLPLRPKDAELVENSAEIEELLRRRGTVIEEGPGADLVRRVGRAVAPASPADPYLRPRFALIRHPVPNAFALPDGQVYVHEGLLALLENEAQLASVLAHECVHFEGHHAIVHARQARKKVGGLVVFEMLLGTVADVGYLEAVLADALVVRLVAQAIIGYGRDLEEEADRRAVHRLLEAGYDPREMPRTFELLAADPEGERPDPKPVWSSHPLAVQRAAYVRAMLDDLSDEIAAAEARHGGLRVGEEQFEAVVHRAAHHSVNEYLEADRPRMGLWLAQRNVERWPTQPMAHAQLGDAWRLLDARSPELTADELSRKEKTARARDRARTTREERLERRLSAPEAEARLETNRAHAEAAYRAALAIEPAHPAALRGLGYLEEDRGRDVEAGHWLARYLRADPEAPDRAVVIHHLQEITERLSAAEGEGK
jgi:predicted Zn-dependent protease